MKCPACGHEQSSPNQIMPLLLRREVAALRMGISLRTLDELLATKQLSSVKVGSRRLISEDAINRFIKKAEEREITVFVKKARA